MDMFDEVERDLRRNNLLNVLQNPRLWAGFIGNIAFNAMILLCISAIFEVAVLKVFGIITIWFVVFFVKRYVIAHIRKSFQPF